MMLAKIPVLVVVALGVFSSGVGAEVTPPAGFAALFNGTDFDGWFGHAGEDPRPLLQASPAELEKIWADSMADVHAHWRVENGELVNDGQGLYLTTKKNYRDFELRVEYKTVAGADSGIYLRGLPQVQIWDTADQDKFGIDAGKGSGGLWNNSPGAPGKDPSRKMDKPFGEWNSFVITMIGERVTVALNGEVVVDDAVMENYLDRDAPMLVKGPVKLQTHGGEIRWRNIFIREIGPDEVAERLAARDAEGFVRVDNGKDLSNWQGAVDEYEVVDGTIRNKIDRGGALVTREEYADFKVRLQFRLPGTGNNGLGIRTSVDGYPGHDGLTEVQVLAEDYDTVKGEPIDPRQAHGSAYGILAARRGYQQPIGEWNYQEVTVRGTTLKVELNGTVILEGDLAAIDPATFMSGGRSPGFQKASGYFGFYALAGHNDPVDFKNIYIKRL